MNLRKLETNEKQKGSKKMEDLSLKKILAIGVSFVVLIIGLFLLGSVMETVDADEIMVVQSPWSGELTWHITAGVKYQGLGKVTKYPKRSIYTFETSVRFNDGGHGTMHGSIQYEMPLDKENLMRLHVRFGSSEAIQKQLIETVTNKSVYMTGPLMSSKESYAEKRNYLISYVEDQISNGVYKTISREQRIKDQMTGADKTVTVVEIVNGANGIPERQEEAVLKTFGIRTFSFAIDKLPYDAEVEGQIKQQQKIAMDVQTAIADAKKAEQRAITVAEQGKADAAQAKWEQEVIKAKAVTEAEQKKEVAKLDAEAAELKKREQTLLGEGEAARKRAVMSADGALEKKLATYVEVNKTWAEAFKGYGGALTPSVVMGGQSGSGSAVSTTQTIIDMIGIKTARDLGLDMSVPRGASPATPQRGAPSK